jgi:hypothetical protein
MAAIAGVVTAEAGEAPVAAVAADSAAAKLVLPVDAGGDAVDVLAWALDSGTKAVVSDAS